MPSRLYYYGSFECVCALSFRSQTMGNNAMIISRIMSVDWAACTDRYKYSGRSWRSFGNAGEKTRTKCRHVLLTPLLYCSQLVRVIILIHLGPGRGSKLPKLGPNLWIHIFRPPKSPIEQTLRVCAWTRGRQVFVKSGDFNDPKDLGSVPLGSRWRLGEGPKAAVFVT